MMNDNLLKSLILNLLKHRKIAFNNIQILIIEDIIKAKHLGNAKVFLHGESVIKAISALLVI